MVEIETTRLTKNCLDLLRFISVPDDDVLNDTEMYLVYNIESNKVKKTADGGNNNDNSSDDEDEDNDGNGVKRLNSTMNKAMAGRSNKGMKRVLDVAVSENSISKKQRKILSPAEQVLLHKYHKKVFSKAWLALLAMPLTKVQHKVILKHLQEFVIGLLPQPLLLADYLTQSYEQGGVVAVLALESLFDLIVKHNLDYPNFFASLYRLCSYEVLSAKYRSKFMKLLSMCLRSANMPVYLVAAFVKRLSQLSLRVPSPSALYCIAQVTWLLRHHPQCLVLIHRHSTHLLGNQDNNEETTGIIPPASMNPSKINKESTPVSTYNPYEEEKIENSNALQSSLWEIEALHQHHVHTVATFARALEIPASTEDSVNAPNLAMDDFLDHSYSSLFNIEISKAKKNSSLAFKAPLVFISSDDLVGKCFG